MLGATEILPNDLYPYVVIKQTKTTYTLRALRCVDTSTGHRPMYYNGPYPVWDHSYSDEEMRQLQIPGSEITIRLHKDGRYYSKEGIWFVIDSFARYPRDYSN